MKTIELNKDLAGTRYGDGMPSGPTTTTTNETYPEFEFTSDKPCDLPDSGELTIKYRLVRHSEDTRSEANPRYGYTICVKKLVSAEGDSDKSPTRKYTEGGEALDALVKEKELEGEY